MPDDELRDKFVALGRSFDRLLPPAVPALRRRARRRAIRQVVTGVSACAAVGVAAVVVLANVLAQHASIPQSRSSPTAPPPAGQPATVSAPYYVSVPGSLPAHAAIRRTVSGKLVASVSAPAGAGFAAVVPAGSARAFLLAVRTIAQTSAPIRFYLLHLGRNGQPGPLQSAGIPALAQDMRNGCRAQLAGLAVTPDGRTAAVSTLSNCVTGTAGPALIEIVSLRTGHIVHMIRPGRDYPLSLSWTASGSLAFDWHEGVWIIKNAASPGNRAPRARRLISSAAGIAGLSGASNSLITPDGSVVLAEIGSGIRTEVAEFSARTGKPLLAIPPVVRNADFCGPLWTGAGARHILLACGAAQESVDNGRRTLLRGSPWRLPSYVVPGPPQIAW